MLATARVERTLGAGVLIPASAVSLRGAGHWVFVQSQPGVFEQREVTLGYEGPREVIVSRGLEVGEQVVAENMLLLARQYRMAQEAASPAPATSEANLAVAPVNRASIATPSIAITTSASAAAGAR